MIEVLQTNEFAKWLKRLKNADARARILVRIQRLSLTKNFGDAKLSKMLCAWKEQADKLSSEEISREEYDNRRYYYPKFDTTQIWAKVPSKELSDALVEAFKDKLKTDD